MRNFSITEVIFTEETFQLLILLNKVVAYLNKCDLVKVCQ